MSACSDFSVVSQAENLKNESDLLHNLIGKGEGMKQIRETSTFFVLTHCFRGLHEDSYLKVFFIILRLRSANDGRTEGNSSVSIVTGPPSFTYKCLERTLT